MSCDRCGDSVWEFCAHECSWAHNAARVQPQTQLVPLCAAYLRTANGSPHSSSFLCLDMIAPFPSFITENTHLRGRFHLYISWIAEEFPTERVHQLGRPCAEVVADFCCRFHMGVDTYNKMIEYFPMDDDSIATRRGYDLWDIIGCLSNEVNDRLQEAA